MRQIDFAHSLASRTPSLPQLPPEFCNFSFIYLFFLPRHDSYFSV